MKKISGFVAKNAAAMSLALIFAGIWPILQITNLKVDNAIGVWLDHHSPEYEEYARFQQKHGNDEWILVVFSVENIPSSQAEAEILSIVNDLGKIDDDVKVLAVSNADSMTMQALGSLLTSPDKNTAGILLNLAALGKIENRSAIVKKVHEALAPHSDRHVFHLGGPTLLNAELDRISERQSRVFMTLAFAISMICLYGVLRSATYAAIALTGAVPAVVLTLGSAVGSGMTLNMITTVLPVLIWVLSLTGGIHLIDRFRKALQNGDSPDKAVGRCIDEVLQPYAVAATTTAIGFLSLLLSHMGPVQDLGLWAAAGLAMGFICNIILIPTLLTLFYRRPFLAKRLFSPPMKINLRPSIIRRYRQPIIIAGILMLIGPMFLIPSLRVESNVLTFFKKDSRIHKDYDFISRNLTGLSTMELDFQGPFLDTFSYTQNLSKRLEGVSDLRPVVYMSGDSFRMSIFVKNMESMGFNKLVEKVRTAISDIGSESVKVRLTGTVLLLNSIQEELVLTQIKSFGIALLTIVIIFILVFRSWKIVAIGTAVNLFPIAVLVGAAAVTGIPLNVATIMIAAIAIGIAVDDTVYFLARLRSEIDAAPEKDRAMAIDSTLVHTDAPITATTLVVSIGFFALIPADFIPIRYFGLLGGLTMISAWIGDLVFLPALLYAFHPRSGEQIREGI